MTKTIIMIDSDVVRSNLVHWTNPWSLHVYQAIIISIVIPILIISEMIMLRVSWAIFSPGNLSKNEESH